MYGYNSTCGQLLNFLNIKTSDLLGSFFILLMNNSRHFADCEFP